MEDFAKRLTSGVLREMHDRILHTNIQREKLELGEDSDRMKAFFEREIVRCESRRLKRTKKNSTPSTLTTKTLSDLFDTTNR